MKSHPPTETPRYPMRVDYYFIKQTMLDMWNSEDWTPWDDFKNINKLGLTNPIHLDTFEKWMNHFSKSITDILKKYPQDKDRRSFRWMRRFVDDGHDGLILYPGTWGKDTSHVPGVTPVSNSKIFAPHAQRILKIAGRGEERVNATWTGAQTVDFFHEILRLPGVMKKIEASGQRGMRYAAYTLLAARELCIKVGLSDELEGTGPVVMKYTPPPEKPDLFDEEPSENPKDKVKDKPVKGDGSTKSMLTGVTADRDATTSKMALHVRAVTASGKVAKVENIDVVKRPDGTFQITADANTGEDATLSVVHHDAAKFEKWKKLEDAREERLGETMDEIQGSIERQEGESDVEWDERVSKHCREVEKGGEEGQDFGEGESEDDFQERSSREEDDSFKEEEVYVDWDHDGKLSGFRDEELNPETDGAMEITQKNQLHLMKEVIRLKRHLFKTERKFIKLKSKMDRIVNHCDDIRDISKE